VVEHLRKDYNLLVATSSCECDLLKSDELEGFCCPVNLTRGNHSIQSFILGEINRSCDSCKRPIAPNMFEQKPENSSEGILRVQDDGALSMKLHLFCYMVWWLSDTETASQLWFL